MHAENLSACACIFACWAGLGGWPPFGMYFRHVFSAAWNAGDIGFTPVFGPKVTVPFADGSGNFGTPWERMHEANFCEFLPPPAIVRLPPDPPPPLVPRPLDDEDDDDEVVVVVDPALATEGEAGLLPQPAAVIAR